MLYVLDGAHRADHREPYSIVQDDGERAKAILDNLAYCGEKSREPLLNEFHVQLQHDKRTVSDWRAHIVSLRSSPGFKTLRQSPLTGRSVSKPRGYSGDAVMIDCIYGLDNSDAATSAGQRIFEWEFASVACRSVRARRGHLATLVDSVPIDARILSVACGHLRELALCDSAAYRRPASIVGLDQDKLSIGFLGSLATPCVWPILGSVKQLLRNDIKLGSFDLIYSAGLYDYLDDRVAKALTRKLISMLRPGGELRIANLTTELPDIPYMEAMMDWWLTYRSADDLQALVAGIDGVNADSYHMSVPNGMNAIAWLSVEKSG
jgi:extracellular factor (EF) 3-hydroxypalmitic acid methyl ester biosynthesis protein